METLRDHTIIYDDECPMCNIYTRAFVKHGLLDKKGRKGFHLPHRGGLPLLIVIHVIWTKSVEISTRRSEVNWLYRH